MESTEPSKELPSQPAPRPVDEVFERRRRTVNLMIAGAVVLLLPLLVIVFLLKNKDAGKGGEESTNLYLFQKRRGGGEILKPVTTAAPNKDALSKSSLFAPAGESAEGTSGQGSMGFIRGGEDYSYEPEKPPVAEVKKEPEAEPKPAKEEAPVVAAPTETRPVARPKLQASGGGSFAVKRLSEKNQSRFGPSLSSGKSDGSDSDEGAGGNQPKLGLGKAAGALPGAVPGGMPDMSALMKNMPAGGMPAGGMPDMSQMMKNMPAGGMPDMSQMMKGMQMPATTPPATTKKKKTGT